MVTEEEVEDIIKEEVVDTIVEVIGLCGTEDTPEALGVAAHVPEVQNEGLCLPRGPGAGLVDLTDPLGPRDLLHLVLHPPTANHLSLPKDAHLWKSRQRKLKGLLCKTVP